MRERNAVVLGKAKRNQLNHFDVDMSKFEDTTKFVVSIIKVRPPPFASAQLQFLNIKTDSAFYSATLLLTTLAFHPTDVGNTSMLEAETASPNFSPSGPAAPTPQNAAAAFSIFSSSPFFSMQVREQAGHTRASRMDVYTEEVRGLQLLVWKCSRMAFSAAILRSYIRLMARD